MNRALCDVGLVPPGGDMRLLRLGPGVLPSCWMKALSYGRDKKAWEIHFRFASHSLNFKTTTITTTKNFFLLILI